MEVSVDEIRNTFVHILQNIVSACVPQTTVTFYKKGQTLPHHIRHLCCQMRAAWVRAKATNSPDWHCGFKARRNKFRPDIRKWKSGGEQHIFLSRDKNALYKFIQKARGKPPKSEVLH